MSNEAQVHQLVKAIFSDRIACAAIMGNIAVESGYDWTIKQRGGNGYGLFQFDFLKPYYFNWLNESGQADSASSQVRFMFETLGGSQKNVIGAGNAKKIVAALHAGDLDHATTAFCELWEKPGVPHLDRRIKAARDALNAEYV